MNIDDVTFWLAFYALIAGSLADVVVIYNYLRKWWRGRHA